MVWFASFERRKACLLRGNAVSFSYKELTPCDLEFLNQRGYCANLNGDSRTMVIHKG